MIVRLFRLLHLLSFDVALGAIACQAYFFHLLDVRSDGWSGLALGTCVLLIYNLDHLLDARKGMSGNSRRVFFHTYSRAIQFFCLVLVAMGLLILTQLDSLLLLSGLGLAGCSIVYLILVHFFPRIWFKEMMVATGYMLGVSLAPLVSSESVDPFILISILQLGLMALVNLLLFSCQDLQEDKELGFSSIAVRFGSSITIGVVYFLLLLLVLSEASLFFIGYNQGVFVLMTLGLLSLAIFRKHFSNSDLFRFAGDAVFFFPLLGLI